MEGKRCEAVVVWSHRVGSIRIDDEDAFVGLDFLPAAYAALVALEESGVAIRLLLPASVSASERDLKRCVPATWQVKTLGKGPTTRAVSVACTSAEPGGLSHRERPRAARGGRGLWPRSPA